MQEVDVVNVVSWFGALLAAVTGAWGMFSESHATDAQTGQRHLTPAGRLKLLGFVVGFAVFGVSRWQQQEHAMAARTAAEQEAQLREARYRSDLSDREAKHEETQRTLQVSRDEQVTLRLIAEEQRTRAEEQLKTARELLRRQKESEQLQRTISSQQQSLAQQQEILGDQQAKLASSQDTIRMAQAEIAHRQEQQLDGLNIELENRKREISRLQLAATPVTGVVISWLAQYPEIRDALRLAMGPAGAESCLPRLFGGTDEHPIGTAEFRLVIGSGDFSVSCEEPTQTGRFRFPNLEALKRQSASPQNGHRAALGRLVGSGWYLLIRGGGILAAITPTTPNLDITINRDRIVQVRSKPSAINAGHLMDGDAFIVERWFEIGTLRDIDNRATRARVGDELYRRLETEMNALSVRAEYGSQAFVASLRPEWRSATASHLADFATIGNLTFSSNDVVMFSGPHKLNAPNALPVP